MLADRLSPRASRCWPHACTANVRPPSSPLTPPPPPPSTPPPTHTCPGRNEGTKDPSFLLAELLIQHQRRPQGAPGAQPRRQSRARGAAVVRRLLALATQPGGAPGGRLARAPRAPALVAVHRLRVLSASPGGCSERGRPRGPRAHPVTPPCASRSPKNVLSSQVPRRIAVPRSVSADSAVLGASEPMYVVIYHLKECSRKIAHVLEPCTGFSRVLL